jgi:hypothetical protein
MLKTNEVRIRSVEKENQTNKKKMANLKKINQDLEKGIVALINETVIRGAKKQEIKELVSNVSQYVDLDEVFNDHCSIDTEEELRISLNESLKALQKQLNGGNEKHKFKLEEEHSLDSLSSQNSPTVVNSKPYKRTLSPMEKERENSQFKLRLEEEIEENIKTRSRKMRELKGTMTVKRTSNGSKQKPSDKKNMRNCKSDLEKSTNAGGKVSIEEKDQLFLKCKILNPDIFETYEKNKIEMRIRTMKSLNDFILWLWEYFEEKCERITSKIKTIETEKSNKIF